MRFGRPRFQDVAAAPVELQAERLYVLLVFRGVPTIHVVSHRGRVVGLYSQRSRALAAELNRDGATFSVAFVESASAAYSAPSVAWRDLVALACCL